jgi:ATPase subunit of ABC transporter with duplicated ATPase domains
MPSSLDVDYQTVTCYVGNYQRFVEQKALIRTQKEAEIARAEKLLADKKAFVERFRAKATKARQAQSRLKQIDKIEVEELLQTSRRAPLFVFDQVRPSGRDVLNVEGVSKAYDDKQVLSDVSLQARRGERIAVIGANGLGKSTLLKILVGALKPDAGKSEWGHEVKVGYFAQDHKELLTDPKLSVLDFVWNSCPQEGTSFVRGRLGRMLFSGEDVDKSMASLSGGEGARLIFCSMMIDKPNVLVLDEPTNHLDLEAIEALVMALTKFEGTLLFVSHDRWFVSRLATRVIEVTKDGLNDHQGTFQEYLDRAGADHLDAGAVALRAKEDKKDRSDKDADPSGAGKLDWETRKRLQNKKKALPKKRDELLGAISAKEARIVEIQASYADPDFFASAPAAEQTALAAEEKAVHASIATLTAQWEQVEEELLELEQLGI